MKIQIIKKVLFRVKFEFLEGARNAALVLRS